MANETIKSLEPFNIEYELFDGVVGREGIKILADHNKFPSVHINNRNWTDGTIGCLASHYLLWDKCSKQNEPFLVLEQDAIVVRDPRELLDDIDKLCHLDATNPFDLDRENHFDFYNKQIELFIPGVGKYPTNSFYGKKTSKVIPKGCFRGTYGYIITPKGAKDIIDWIDKHGLLPSDACLNHSATNLQRSNSTYVRLNPFFSTLELQQEYSLRNPNNKI
jgi:glycosyl transferase family 25